MQIRGAAFGIGGHVKFAFGTPTDMLRIGAEGHSSNVRYAPSPSYAHTGWGGIIVDYIRRTEGRVHPFIGCLIGGGGVKNHIIAQGGTGDFVIEPQAAMHKYAFMAIAPFLGMEVALTPKLSLVLKADWLLNATGPTGSSTPPAVRTTSPTVPASTSACSSTVFSADSILHDAKFFYILCTL